MSENKDVLAHQRIDDHERLCRIMQEETNKKIEAIHNDVHRLEKIMNIILSLQVVKEVIAKQLLVWRRYLQYNNGK